MHCHQFRRTSRDNIRPLKQSSSALTLIAALAFVTPFTAHAANYSVSTQAELANAIATANADSDPTATITLTSDISLSNDTSFALGKSMLIDTNGFVLTGGRDLIFDVSDGAQLTFTGNSATVGQTGTEFGKLRLTGSGTKILTGMTGNYDGSLFSETGVVRVEGGSQIIAGNISTRGVDMAAGEIIISGTGTFVDTTRSGIIIHSQSSLKVEQGAHLNTSFLYGQATTTDRGLVVTGAGSLLTTTDVYAANMHGNFSVFDGGTVETTNTIIGGFPVNPSPTGNGTIIVSGAGSKWSSSAVARIHRGLVTDLCRSLESLKLVQGDREDDEAFRRVQAGSGADCADQWAIAATCCG